MSCTDTSSSDMILFQAVQFATCDTTSCDVAMSSVDVLQYSIVRLINSAVCIAMYTDAGSLVSVDLLLCCGHIHCVRKKVNHYIHFHNSGKQCRILAKFYNNNATSNCKQTTKFQ